MPGTPLILGVRHHGPGSARSVVAALEVAKPTELLIEGPEEMEPLIPHLLAAKPPFAALFYDVDVPRHAIYYPFAEFSPELQAMRWAHANGVPVRFFDLPASAKLGMRVVRDESSDAMERLAEAAGFEDVEDWWEHLVEHRSDPAGLFEGLEELMGELRKEPLSPRDASPPHGDALPIIEPQEDPPQPEETEEAPDDDPRPEVPAAEYERLREDHMRRALTSGCAVVCGAWHAPALREKPRAKAKLPKVKVGATLVPWTYDRLTFESGYGAGARSPAFYDLLWNTPAEAVTRRWLLEVARLLREGDLDASPASVIEAVRLAEALAALRGRPRPGLRELWESAGSVLVRDDAAWSLIRRRLVVGERIGEVPEGVPAVPLQNDLRALQKRLRLPLNDTDTPLNLDLRNETDLTRSRLFHRLNLLDIPWAVPERVQGSKKGTFHEPWRLRWRPELAISVVEASPWGNTVLEASTARVAERAKEAATLAQIAALVETTLLADLEAEAVVQRLLDLSATAADVADLADALPPLAGALRYGSVRLTESERLEPVVGAILTRLCLGLPGACAGLDDESGAATSRRLTMVASVVRLLGRESLWLDALRAIAERADAHPLLKGKAERLRFDFGAITGEELALRLRQESSAGATALETAAFVEGLLEGSGSLLIHQESLWSAVDEWVASLEGATFDEILPLVRRTFALFTKPERRQLGERATGGTRPVTDKSVYDEERGARVLPVVRRILGL